MSQTTKNNINKSSVESAENAAPVRLENLEQRILLAGDLPVGDTLNPLAIDAQVITVDANSVTVVSPSGAVESGIGLIDDGNIELKSGYSLTGSGDIDVDLLNEGEVAPGNSAGTLSVNSFQQNRC